MDSFIGREAELRELRAAVEDSLSGRGRVVMIVGEPGIEKTRTGEDLASGAGKLKAGAFWGRSNEADGAPH